METQYLTKKHLKKNNFENFLRFVYLSFDCAIADCGFNMRSADVSNRVVATAKDTYSLRYFKVDQDEAEEEE